MPRALTRPAAVVLLAFVTLASWALASCDGGGSIAPGQARYVEAVAGTWQRVNPLFATSNEVDADLSRLVFSGLTRIEPDGTVAPDLAESWDVVDDGRTYRFHLREGVHWHDGKPFTAADVAFTIARVRDADFRGDALLASAWNSVEISTPDDLTVEFRLPEASAPFLARQTTLGILPEHVLAGSTGQTLFDSAFNSRPIGTGPFELTSLTQESATLDPYSQYHGDPAATPLELRFYPDYPGAVRAVESGDADGLMLRETADPQLKADLENVGGTAVATPQRASYLVLYLNNSLVPFDDQSVRRAISLALDREALVTEALDGDGTASASPVTPGTWAYSAGADKADQNLDEARSLLEAAGWTPGANGILVRAGQEFRFTIRTDDEPGRVAMANAVATQLIEVGISANVHTMSAAVLLRDFLQQRQYQAAIVTWNQGADPDMYAWHSSQQGPDGRNIANTDDPVIDALISEARVADDPEIRADYYRQLQDVWAERVPSAILAYPRYTYVQDSDLDHRDYGVLSSPAERFAGVSGWRY